MKRIIEYIKDVLWWLNHYDSKWWKNKKYRKIALFNALYCTAPAHWTHYNKFLKHII